MSSSPRPRASGTVPAMLPQQAPRRPTMRDVAALAGVSLSTVSRVVSGSQQVDPELAVKVEKAVEMLGYRHNLAAGNLRRADGLSASIGLVFEDVSNPFFSAVHRGVEDVARKRSRAHLRRQLGRGPRARARAHRGIPRAPRRRPGHRAGVGRSQLPGARRRGRHGARLRRPPAALHRRRRRGERQRRRRPHGGRAPGRGRPSPDRVPGRQARDLHGRGAAARLPRGARAARRRAARRAGAASGVPRRRRRRHRARAARRREPADGAVHGAEPDHAGRPADAARAGAPAHDRARRVRRRPARRAAPARR